MKITHLGYEISCEPNEAWDGSFKSNMLVILKPAAHKRAHSDKFLVSMWWPGKVKDGIKEGVKLVDKHVKAMTISPGKG